MVLIKVCKQLVEVKKCCKARKGLGYNFPIKLGHYKCRKIQDALKLKIEINSLNLLTYSPRPNFDSREFSMKYSKIASSDTHIPHLEDFWENRQTNFEVRKKLWSRLTLSQTRDFNLPLDISGVTQENEEEFVDLVYIEKVEAYPSPEID